MPKSLKSRLSVAASLVLLVFLGVTAYALDTAFRQSLELAKEQELRLHIHSLIIEAEPSQARLSLPQFLPEARFNTLNSGLYAAAASSDHDIFWYSESSLLINDTISALSGSRLLDVGSSAFSRRVFRKDDAEVFVYQHVYEWRTLDGVDRSFVFSIIETVAGFDQQVQGFRQTLWRWLAFAGCALVLVLWGVLFWGLRPLRKIAEELEAIESGQLACVSGDYPSELTPMTTNLNRLVANEKGQRERYRNTLSDLAHSLKTPLAILNGMKYESSGMANDEQSKVNERLNAQVERMNQIVDYQLQRAVAAGPTSILARVNVAEVITRVLSALEKVYAEKSVQVECALDREAVFFGDEGDLMELIGNLLDNAFKYGNHRLRVITRCIEKKASSADGYRLTIIVEDDGCGMAAEHIDTVFVRGVRADTLQAGQGIGLAVVNDIVTSYGGETSITQSSLGGSRFSIAFG